MNKNLWIFLTLITALIIFQSCSSDKDDNNDPVNNEPIINSVIVDSTNVHPGVRVGVHVDATDPDGDILSYMYEFLGGNNGVFYGEGADVEFTINTTGSYTLRVTVYDDSHVYVNYDVSITGVNSSPVIQSINVDSTNVHLGSSIDITVVTTDADNDSLIFGYNVEPMGATINETGPNVTIPINQVGVNTVLVYVSDVWGGYTSRDLILNGIASSPVIDSFTSDDDVIRRGAIANITCLASGGEGTLEYQFSAGYGDIVQNENLAEYTSATYYSGLDEIYVQVNDSLFNVILDTLTIRINEPPVITDISTSFDRVGKGMRTDISIGVIDEENDVIDYAYTIIEGGGTITGSGEMVEFRPTVYGDNYIEAAINDPYSDVFKDTIYVFCDPMWQPVLEVNVIDNGFNDFTYFDTKIFVAHTQADSSIQVKTFNGSSWVNEGASIPGGAWNTGKFMITGSDMYLYHAYMDWTEFAVKRAVYKYNGFGWNVHAPLSNGGSNDWMDATANGTDIYVATSSNKTVVEKFDGANWSIIGDSLSTTDSYYNQLGTDTQGNVFLAFIDGATTKMMKWNGTVWSTIGDGFTPGEANNLSLKMKGDVPYIGFVDDANSDRMTIMYYDGSWSTVGTPGFPYYLSGTGDPNPVMGSVDFAFDGDDIYAGYQQTGLPGINKTAPSVMKWDGLEWTLFGKKYVTDTTPCYGLVMIVDENGIPHFVTATDDGSFSTVWKFE